MTFYDRHKCHKMSFYDIYDGHKVSQKYGNMGIKLTVLISQLQINTKNAVFTYGGIKKTKLVILQIFPFVLPFIKWGSLEGTLIHYQWKKQNYFWAQYTIGRQIKHLLKFSLRKRGEWHTLMNHYPFVCLLWLGISLSINNSTQLNSTLVFRINKTHNSNC